MKWKLSFSFLLLVLAGCCATQERDALLLPGDIKPRAYAEVVERLHKQAAFATEAFYRDEWVDVEDAAHALEQSARFLPVAENAPEAIKSKLTAEAEQLGKEASKLRAAAKKQSVEETNASLQSIHLAVRALHKGS
jgi:hypothetical protein